MLIRRFSMCSDSVKTVLFRSYCTSLYTPQLWWSYSKESIRKLNVAFNNVSRHLISVSRYSSFMFAARNLPTRNIVIRRNTFTFMSSFYYQQTALLRVQCRVMLLMCPPYGNVGDKHCIRILYLPFFNQVSFFINLCIC